MNKRWRDSKKSAKNSPVLFEDEEICTSSSDEVKIKLSATPKSHTGHSTPVRSKNDVSDLPDLSYNESPIEQLTQHPPNEVGWDYHRPFTKEENGKSVFTADINITPKRNMLLSKKRNSNSPLLHKPLKKKLMHEEHKEDVVGFMEELQAIATNLKMNEERNTKNPKKTEHEVESQLVIEINQPSDESDIKLQMSNNTDESPGGNNVASKNKNYEALLDDSMENMMVLCSQEVEKEFCKKKSPLSSNSSRKKEASKISPNSSLEKIFKNSSKENVQPEIEKTNVSSEKHSSVSKGESCSSEIPDDSFDQFFTEIDDEDFFDKNIEGNVSGTNNSMKIKSYPKQSTTSSTTSASKNSTIQNKFFESKSVVSTSSKPPSAVINNHESQSVTVQNKPMNSNANFGYLYKGSMKNDSSGFGSQSTSTSNDKSSETRFLKAKSFSGSNVQMQNSYSTNRGFTNYNSRSSSHLNVNAMKGEQKVNLISISENKGWRRTNSGSSIGLSSSNSNTQVSVNRLGSSGSQMHFTPEEIERKRLEALSRREAKKKSNNLTMTRTMHNPIK